MTTEDSAIIRGIISTRFKSGLFPFHDDLIWLPNNQTGQSLKKLELGSKYDVAIFAIYTTSRQKIIYKDEYGNKVSAASIACISLLPPFEDIRLYCTKQGQFNFTMTYVLKSIFILDGGTKDSPIELSSNFCKALKAAIGNVPKRNNGRRTNQSDLDELMDLQNILKILRDEEMLVDEGSSNSVRSKSPIEHHSVSGDIPKFVYTHELPPNYNEYAISMRSPNSRQNLAISLQFKMSNKSEEPVHDSDHSFFDVRVSKRGTKRPYEAVSNDTLRPDGTKKSRSIPNQYQISLRMAEKEDCEEAGDVVTQELVDEYEDVSIGELFKDVDNNSSAEL